jgi:hypothetical protein
MSSAVVDGQRRFRLWIATYHDWRPTCWSDMPPRATAIELVEDRLYSAEEAAMFVAGFNGQVLESDRPVWAIAVPVTICYLGDAEPGAVVCGHSFAQDLLSANLTEPADKEPLDNPSAVAVHAHDLAVDVAGCPAGERVDLLAGDQSQGFDQSPQRSR